MSGGTFDSLYGMSQIRAADHQMVQPNYFFYVGAQGGKLRPIITTTFAADQATPPPSGECKMPKL